LPALFFDRSPPAASATNTVARSARLKAFDLIAPAADGVATQPGDFNQLLDTAVLCG
jgi:hypothetical protein